MKKVLLLLLVIVLNNFIYAQNEVEKILNDKGEVQIKIEKPNNPLFYEICDIFQVENVKDNYVYLFLDKNSWPLFKTYNIDYEIHVDYRPTLEELNMKSSINESDRNGWDYYPTYETYLDMMYQFETDYPELCEVHEFCTLPSGRKLLAVKISDNVDQDEAEAEFFYTSSMHGDETTGWILQMRLIDYLLENYDNDDRVEDLVNNLEIWINPLANPDGTYHGGNNNVYGAIRRNANGVDLNRNYPDPAAGFHPDNYDWQPETLAFMAFAEGRDFVMSANFHGGIEVANYPWDTWSYMPADVDWFKLVCHEYADNCQANSPNGYMVAFDDGITNGYAWYRVKGGRQDFMNYNQQCKESTIELSDVKLLSASLLPAHWDYNKESLLLYMEQCYYGIHGTVKDSLTDEPIYAEIRIDGHDVDSSWVYSSMPHGDFYRPIFEGDYNVTISAPGYLSKTVSVTNLYNYEKVTLDIKLIPGGVGVGEFKVMNASVFPNPSSNGRLNFKSNKIVNELIIFDLAGKEVLRKNINTKASSIDVSGLTSGLYFLHLKSDKDFRIIKTEIK